MWRREKCNVDVRDKYNAEEGEEQCRGGISAMWRREKCNVEDGEVQCRGGISAMWRREKYNVEEGEMQCGLHEAIG